MAEASKKAPAFQWFPGDFRRDTAVQSCTFEARSLWREMIDLMHDGEPYGHLTAGGLPIDGDRLARIVGLGRAKVTRLLAELEERKVFSRTAEGVIYSRRMVRDEHTREVRRNAGKLGGNPELKHHQNGKKDNPVVNRQVNQNGSFDYPESNLGPNQSPKQKPTPAVSGLRTAVASKSGADSLQERAAAAEPASASASLRSDQIRFPTLPTGILDFVDRFYPVPGKRRKDVERQLVKLAMGERVQDRRVSVIAHGIDRLEAKCREVIADNQVRDLDKAIVVLFAKLIDTSDVTTARVASEHRERADDEQLGRQQERLADAWSIEHPELAQKLEAEMLEQYPGDSVFMATTRHWAFIAEASRRSEPIAAEPRGGADDRQEQ